MTNGPTPPGGEPRDGFTTIAVALDGSTTAELGIPLATRLAKHDGARIVFVHVEQIVAAAGTVVPVHANEAEIQSRLRVLIEKLLDEGVEASLEIRKMVLGGPALSIADVADQVKADLIVVGTQGHSTMGALFLGSVTQRLLQVAHQPVLAVPGERE